MNLLNALGNLTGTATAEWRDCGEPGMVSTLGLDRLPGHSKTFAHVSDGRMILVNEDRRQIFLEPLPTNPNGTEELPPRMDKPRIPQGWKDKGIPGGKKRGKHASPKNLPPHLKEAHSKIAKELRHHLIEPDTKLEKLSLLGSVTGIITATLILFAPDNGQTIFDSQLIGPSKPLEKTAGILCWMSIIFALHILSKKAKKILIGKKLRSERLHEKEADRIIDEWTNPFPQKESAGEEIKNPAPRILGTRRVSPETRSIILDILRDNLPKNGACPLQQPTTPNPADRNNPPNP